MLVIILAFAETLVPGVVYTAWWNVSSLIIRNSGSRILRTTVCLSADDVCYGGGGALRGRPYFPSFLLRHVYIIYCKLYSVHWVYNNIQTAVAVQHADGYMVRRILPSRTEISYPYIALRANFSPRRH